MNQVHVADEENEPRVGWFGDEKPRLVEALVLYDARVDGIDDGVAAGISRCPVVPWVMVGAVLMSLESM